jgi:hypothetical protein
VGVKDLSAVQDEQKMKPNKIVAAEEKEYRGQPSKGIARLPGSCYMPIPLLTSETRME